MICRGDRIAVESERPIAIVLPSGSWWIGTMKVCLADDSLGQGWLRDEARVRESDVRGWSGASSSRTWGDVRTEGYPDAT